MAQCAVVRAARACRCTAVAEGEDRICRGDGRCTLQPPIGQPAGTNLWGRRRGRRDGGGATPLKTAVCRAASDYFFSRFTSSCCISGFHEGPTGGGQLGNEQLVACFPPSFGLLLPGIPDWCQRGTLESVAAAAAAAAAATAILTQLRRPPTTPACPSQRDVQASAWPRPSCLGCSIECIDWGGSLMRVGSTTERDGRAPAGPWAGGGGGSEWEWGYTGDRYDYHLNLAEWHLCAL